MSSVFICFPFDSKEIIPINPLKTLDLFFCFVNLLLECPPERLAVGGVGRNVLSVNNQSTNVKRGLLRGSSSSTPSVVSVVHPPKSRTFLHHLGLPKVASAFAAHKHQAAPRHLPLAVLRNSDLFGGASLACGLVGLDGHFATPRLGAVGGRQPQPPTWTRRNPIQTLVGYFVHTAGVLLVNNHTNTQTNKYGWLGAVLRGRATTGLWLVCWVVLQLQHPVVTNNQPNRHRVQISTIT